MDYRKLQTLLTVAASGSLNAAAEQLNCTQSAVTQIMNTIENELGFPVFNRSNRGVTLTAEGSAIMPYVTAAEQALTELAQEAGKIAAGKRTPLRVGTYSSISTTLMPGIISAFRKLYPDVVFEIIVGADELPKYLESGKVHVLLVESERKVGKHWYPVLEDQIYAVAPESYGLGSRQAISVEELTEYPIILNPLDLFTSGIRPLNEAPDVTKVMAADSLPQLRIGRAGTGNCPPPGAEPACRNHPGKHRPAGTGPANHTNTRRLSSGKTAAGCKKIRSIPAGKCRNAAAAVERYIASESLHPHTSLKQGVPDNALTHDRKDKSRCPVSFL